MYTWFEGRILFYDRNLHGERRLHTNTELLREFGNGIMIEPVDRVNDFMGKPGASSLLLADEFSFDGVLVHADGDDAARVLEDAVLGRDCRNQSFPIVGITAFSRSSSEGILYVPIRAGNGYLMSSEADRVMDHFKRYLSDLARKPTSPLDIPARL